MTDATKAVLVKLPALKARIFVKKEPLDKFCQHWRPAPCLLIATDCDNVLYIYSDRWRHLRYNRRYRGLRRVEWAWRYFGATQTLVGPLTDITVTVLTISGCTYPTFQIATIKRIRNLIILIESRSDTLRSLCHRASPSKPYIYYPLGDTWHSVE